MNIKIENGVFHAHSEYSIYDSSTSPKELAKRVSELGGKFLALTEHGVMTSMFKHLEACKEFGIKGIVGIEAYVKEDTDTSRSHLVIIAKNYKGYKALCKAITMSYERMDSNGYPLMNKEILDKCFGASSGNFGSVFATSACVAGVIANKILVNEGVKKSISDLQSKIEVYNFDEKKFILDKSTYKEISDEVDKLQNEKSELLKISKKSTQMLEKNIEMFKAEKSPLLTDALKKLDEIKNAGKKAEEINKELLVKKKEKKTLGDALKITENVQKEIESYKKEIAKLTSKLKSDDDIKSDADNEVREYAKIFGVQNFLIELQYHRIKNERIVYPMLWEIAKKRKLRVIAANDCHYAYNDERSIVGRQLNQSKRYPSKTYKASCFVKEEGYGEYYIKTDEELKAYLSEILPPEAIEAAFDGQKYIYENCNIEFPQENHFPKYKLYGKITAKEQLKSLCEKGKKKLFPNDWDIGKQKRLDYELSVIDKMGFNDYHLIVADFCKEGRKKAVNNPEHIGYGVGWGRGSAVGSLVCYLLEITQVNPLKHGLLFERYLNVDRVSLPDIDIDFARSIRKDMIEYTKKVYGEKAVCSIIAEGTQAVKAALLTVCDARGYELPYSITSIVPKECGTTVKDFDVKLKSGERLGNYLAEKYKKDRIVSKIIEEADYIDGSVINNGCNASAVIISDSENADDYIPLMWNKDQEIWQSQFNKEEAEKYCGLLKMDFLGLKTLDVISDTVRAVKRETGKHISLENVDISDQKVYESIFQTGNTLGIFQFESLGMQTMLKRLKPKSIDDLFLCIALYRPATLQYIDEIVEVANGNKKPTYIIPELEDIFGTTYGKPIYQEQILQVFNRFAGFTLGEADIIRRIMAKKKHDELVKYKDKFISGFVSSGASIPDAEAFWEELLQFASYTFNKSHSAAYSYLVFYTAYLKTYYPTYFMASLMNYQNAEKLTTYVADCKRMGIKIKPVDINTGSIGFKAGKDFVKFGFSSLKGIGNSSEVIIEKRSEKPFTSFKDFVLRTNLDTDCLDTLIRAGACDCWCGNRIALIQAVEPLKQFTAKITKNEKDFAIINNTDISKLNTKSKATFERKKASCEIALNEWKSKFREFTIDSTIYENKFERLSNEKKLYGTFITGNPLNDYPAYKKMRNKSIVEATGFCTISGICEGYKKSVSKNKKEYAIFNLIDETDEIKCVAFQNVIPELEEILKKSSVISISGNLKEENEVRSIIVNKVSAVPIKVDKCVISVPNIVAWAERGMSAINDYVVENSEYSLELLIYDESLSEFRVLNNKIYLSRDILKSNIGEFKARII